MIVLAVKPWSWWFTIRELQQLRLPALPRSTRGLNGMAGLQGWKWRRSFDGTPFVRIRAGTSDWEYHAALLPDAAQEQLLVLERLLRKDEGSTCHAVRRLLGQLSVEERKLFLLQLVADEFAR